ncbi:Na/Pi cotransporter family protein [Terasakiella sp. A23]|uniref:Na/Pi cotransporter family protein n=1 Tax=Terasakiella sp. FCG-A23 TaxID=3080561 RepID=UPI00295472AA|nr:Na/Pi cotransporter family protein [Terasakiella sp. A23]MDV7339362.1 Na/Pi cotransporter family protein [Terasakiella sp. A23]
MATGNELDIFNISVGLAGGLALFLFGLEQLSAGLKAVAGEKMKTILGKLTSNRFIGMFTGAFVTAVIQSSSVTTVLVVGFISAGLMKLSQSIGIIMGANVGTTITAQIIAFKITHFAMLMVAVGFAMLFFGRNDKLKQYGNMLMGLGMVFLGMNLMSEAMQPLRSYEPFLDLMVSMENPILGLLVGAAFTALVQSSSATTGIVIALATQGLLSLPGGIALIFGANVGTCVTAMLATIGKPREAFRAAVVHVLFNVAGVLLWIGFVDQLAAIVRDIGGDESGTARDIANAHTIFNVANAFIFIWFVTPFAVIVEKLVPLKPDSNELSVKPKYLEEPLISTPSIALNAVRLELGQLGKHVQKMMTAILPATLTGTHTHLDKVAEMDNNVDQLHMTIIKYVRKIGAQSLGDEDMREVVRLMSAANHLENIGDLIETDMVQIGKRRIAEKVTVSPQTTHLLKSLHDKVDRALETALEALHNEDAEAAQRVIDMKDGIAKESKAISEHGAQRLMTEGTNRHHTYSREMETVERLRRIYYFSKRIAKGVVAKAESLETENWDEDQASGEKDLAPVSAE